MRSVSRRNIVIAGVLVAITGAVLVGVSFLGQMAIGSLLARNAIETAEIWYFAAAEDGRAAIQNLSPGQVGDSMRRSLDLASIDAIVSVRSNGSILPLAGTRAEAAEHLRQATADAVAADAAASPFALVSRAYSNDRVAWLGKTQYASWVLLPTNAADQSRLAVRVRQDQAATQAASEFERQIFFSGGVAIITFCSFMAGFSYRARQLAAENAAMRHIALHDEMTGLPNRKQFDDVLTSALTAASELNHKVALLILDLDGFKSVNDTLGHPVGDGLLKAAAKRLKGSLRGGDLLARLSGDEFAIVVPKVKDASMLGVLADRVLTLLSNPFRVDGHEIQIGCSIGLAVAPENGADIDTLMRNADFALYRAKSDGRKTWRSFDPRMAEDMAGRRTLESGLRHALENNHFELLYQPQVELPSGRTVGYEAVLRWRLPGKGLIPANVFFSIAEETGLVVPIGEWVIAQVARDIALLPPNARVAINLSATQLKRDGIDTFIVETLRRHRVAPSRIDIEVNETILGRDEAASIARLEKIRAAGLSVVLDSFGVGNVSLGLLSRYSFDRVKVDRSFLNEDDHKNIAVLAAICSLGRSLGFSVAGQGVETAEHAQLLRAAGCSVAQGYYFAPPMPLSSVVAVEDENEQPLLAASA